MKRTANLFGSCILAAVILAPLAGAGCHSRVQVYDADHRDYHQWDDHEDRAYRSYLAERHEEYREFSQRSQEEQRDYWNWRHNHPDAGG